MCLVLIRLCWYLLLDVIGVGCCVWVWPDCLLLGGYLLIVSIVVCCVGVLRWLLAYCWFDLLYDVFCSLWFIWVRTWSDSRFSLWVWVCWWLLLGCCVLLRGCFSWWLALSLRLLGCLLFVVIGLVVGLSLFSGVALGAPLGSVGRLLFWVWWVCLLRGLGWVAVGCLQLISGVGLLAVG